MTKPISTSRHRLCGFTLVETMITVAVAAILLTLAVPSMQDFITRNRMTTEVNTMVASFYLARSEAVKRLQNVKVCPANANFTKCTGSSWQNGWMVFVDLDGDGSVAAAETVLQQNPGLPDRFVISATRVAAVFKPNGQATGDSNNTLIFCDDGGVAPTKKIYLSNEGRVRVEPQSSSGKCSKVNPPPPAE